MFKNIYFNPISKKITLWETYNGKTSKLVEDYEYQYYIKDPQQQSHIKDIHGYPVIPKLGKDRKQLKSLKDSGLELFESDLNEDMSYLQKRYGKVKLEPNIDNFNVAYIDIEIESGNSFPKPEEADYEINLISVYSSKTKQMYTWGNREYTGGSKEVQNYAWIPDEKKRLEHFVSWWRKQKFDIATGWNVLDFDFQYILNRLEKLGIEKSLSPLNIVKHRNIKQKKTNKTTYHCSIAGLSVIDYLALYKKCTFNIFSLESYSLNFVANHEKLGGKLELDGHINDVYKTNWNQFVEYNVQDVHLVRCIENKNKFLELTLLLASESLVPLERVSSSIALIEGYILRKLHDNNMVMPDRKRGQRDTWKELGLYKCDGELQNTQHEKGLKTFEDFYVKGGHVYAEPGLWKHLESFDVASFYPHNIMQYNISPETKVFNPTQEQIQKENLIKTPLNGVYYRREKGILSDIVGTVFNERKKFKKKMFEAAADNDKKAEDFYKAQQMIRKIMINSIYGVMINSYFHFYDVDNARVVTRAARTLIRFLSDTTDEYFKTQWHKIYKNVFPHCTNPQPLKNRIVRLIDTDSVIGSSIVNTDNGNLEIEELFNKTDNVIQKDTDNFVANFDDDVFGLSYNTYENKVEYKKIKYVMKHKVKKKMYKLVVGDKEVIMTEDHSIIINRNGEFADVSPKDIRKGDKVISKKLSLVITDNFKLECLGEQEEWVYDIEVEDNHNFFANDILVHNSNYLCLDEIKEKYAPIIPFEEFAEMMEKKVLDPFYDKVLQIWADKYGTEQIIKFKREGVISKQLILAKKKYLTLLLKDEDKVFNTPKLKATGIEIKRSDTPKFCRNSISKVIDSIFEGEDPDREYVIKTIKSVRKEFMKQKVEDISFNKGVSDYRKYAVKPKGNLFYDLQFKPSTPIHVRASIVYNTLVTAKQLPYLKVDNLSKIKYVFVKENNIMNSNVVGYIGNYPKEFKEFFKIDKKMQFEKSFLGVIQRIFDVLEWGEINFKTNKLKAMLG